MKWIRNRHLLASDLLALALAPFVMYALRFEGFAWSAQDLHAALWFAAFSVPCSVAVFWVSGLYRRLWRYASIAELGVIFVAGIGAALICTLVGLILPVLGLTAVRVPISVLFMYGIGMLGIIGLPRLLLRAGRPQWATQATQPKARSVLIVGAGTAGQMVVKELLTNRDLNMLAVGFVDDDPAKRGLRLSNLPVFGSISELTEIVRKHDIEEVIVAMPRAAGTVLRQVVRAAADAGVKTRTVPGLFEILSDRVQVTSLREVRIEDLLRREPVQTNLAQVASIVHDRCVMVTGAGGSIGSELSRQLAALRPSQLLLVGHGENPIFEILNELRAAYPLLPLIPIIADTRNRQRVQHIFSTHRPHAVFHAAAHKHVPLMEENVIEAITNNVAGTRNVVDAAASCDTRNLVLISTDKAVRPTSVMGATKRIAEHIVHAAALRHRRNFVSVRFGNVLGSQGSVVPIFVRQIQAGGPVTVTHPEMRRFFMTIPEAVQLVLQAGALGAGGELFMLDMGEPIRIVDLARDMIRLSGLEEGVDIDIKFTGTRPGEKLYEEMFFSHELAIPTAHPKVLRARNGHREDCADALIERLEEASERGADAMELRALLRAIVPDFGTPPLDGEGPYENGNGYEPAPKRRTPGADTTRAAAV